MSKKQIYGHKRVNGITFFNFFPSSNLTPLHNGLITIVSVYNDIIKDFQYLKIQ